MWAIFKIFSGAVYLLSIILSIPIAFDVGGRDSGLAYSLSIFLFYFFYSFVKAITPKDSRLRSALTNLLGTLQWIVLPSLLIWSLSRFSVDAGSTDWVSRTLGHIRPAAKYTESWHEWFFGQDGMLEHLTLGGWDNGLSYSSPVFQLLEGFCSLLVIQAAGQITRWLVNRGRSDTWIVSTQPTKPGQVYNPANQIFSPDCARRLLRLHHGHRSLLPLARRQVPADQQPRRDLDRRHNDLGSLSLRLRNRQRPGQPG